jgi:hypothetical protein
MSYFVQANKYYMSKHARFQYLIFVYIFEINYFKIWILGILYKTIMHKNRFGQVYYKDHLNRILRKFTL